MPIWTYDLSVKHLKYSAIMFSYTHTNSGGAYNKRRIAYSPVCVLYDWKLILNAFMWDWELIQFVYILYIKCRQVIRK